MKRTLFASLAIVTAVSLAVPLGAAAPTYVAAGTVLAGFSNGSGVFCYAEVAAATAELSGTGGNTWVLAFQVVSPCGPVTGVCKGIQDGTTIQGACPGGGSFVVSGLSSSGFDLGVVERVGGIQFGAYGHLNTL